MANEEADAALEGNRDSPIWIGPVCIDLVDRWSFLILLRRPFFHNCDDNARGVSPPYSHEVPPVFVSFARELSTGPVMELMEVACNGRSHKKRR